MTSTARRITYLTGTRADFGLMRGCLHLLDQDPELMLELVVTGMHLSDRFGYTVDEIRESGLAIGAEIAVAIDDETGSAMAQNIATVTASCVRYLEDAKPDMLLLLGDRGEMLAGAIAALHLNIPVLHIHGGERSGTVDEPVRHAISKLSHLHLVASQDAKDRLIKMGERDDMIHITGAPGLDGITDQITISRDALCQEEGFSADKPVALMLFHPVLQDASQAGKQVESLMSACLEAGVQLMCLMPNSDAGSQSIRAALEKFAKEDLVRIRTHMPRALFLNWLAHCDFMIGNSSSGIIEAASFHKAVINVGSRQNLRLQSGNVINVPAQKSAISAAIETALSRTGQRYENLYGDGKAGMRILSLVKQVEITQTLLHKVNSY